MTIEEKRRKLFEDTFRDEACLDMSEILPGEYEANYVRYYWYAFNAALDAVVIEFVEEYEATETGEHAQQVALVANCMLDDCRAAIESTGLGLKVKP